MDTNMSKCLNGPYSTVQRSEDEQLQLYRQLIKIGFYQACRCKMPLHELEDCAHGFALHILSQHLPKDKLLCKAYLFQCALNYACNYLRTLPNFTLFENSPLVAGIPCPHSQQSLEHVELRYLLSRYLVQLKPR